MAYGRWDGLVDAEPARQHVQQLRGQGLSLPSIARLAGVSLGAVNALVYPTAGRGRSQHLRGVTSRRLLEVTFACELLPDGHRLDAGDAQAVLRDLLAAGYVMADLASATGLSSSTVRRVLQARSVTVGTDRQLHSIHTRTRTRGCRAKPVNGSIEADEPRPCGSRRDEVDDVAVARAMDGEQLVLTVAERREAVRRLSAIGCSAPEIARRLGVCGRTVTRARAALRTPGAAAHPGS